ncbi:hypothetical protein HDU98_001884 [Podochytrium sp. JEL0797]|nr:hypothetical protein HDU98_001884 [Podochytrium sp. JEL0797]
MSDDATHQDLSNLLHPKLEDYNLMQSHLPQDPNDHHHAHFPHHMNPNEYDPHHSSQHLFMPQMHMHMPMNMFHGDGPHSPSDNNASDPTYGMYQAHPQSHMYHQDFVDPRQHQYHHQQYTHQDPHQQQYMNPAALHMQAFSHHHPHHAHHHSRNNQGFLHPGAAGADFSPIPLTLIEGGFENADAGLEQGHADFSNTPFLGGAVGGGMPMMVGIGPDGNPMRFDKHGDSPSMWGWAVTHPEFAGDELQQQQQAPPHLMITGGEGMLMEENHTAAAMMMMDAGEVRMRCAAAAAESEMDPMAASASAAAAIAAQAGYLMGDNRMECRGMNGVGGGAGGEGVFARSETGGSSSQGDEEGGKEKGLKRGKGAVYCMHEKILKRCNDCNASGVPGAVTRVSAICHHGKRRSQCIQCYDEGTGGSIICEHRRQKYACPKCFDAGRETNSLCVHRTIKFKCKICSPAVHQPKAYKKRLTGPKPTKNPSAAPKKRGPNRKRDPAAATTTNTSGNHAGNASSLFNASFGDDESGSGGGMMSSSQQPMFYQPHHPMMFSMPMQQHSSMQQHGDGSGHAPGYLFAMMPPQGTFESSFTMSTPLATRTGSPELNKMAEMQQHNMVPGTTTGDAGEVQYLVPTVLPHGTFATGTASAITPTVSPPTTNTTLASASAAVPPPNQPPSSGPTASSDPDYSSKQATADQEGAETILSISQSSTTNASPVRTRTSSHAFMVPTAMSYYYAAATAVANGNDTGMDARGVPSSAGGGFVTYIAQPNAPPSRGVQAKVEFEEESSEEEQVSDGGEYVDR